MNIAQKRFPRVALTQICYSCGKPAAVIQRGHEPWIACKCGNLSPSYVNTAAIHTNGLPCQMCRGKGFRMVQDEVEGIDGRWIDIEVRRACQLCTGAGRVAA